MREHDPSFRPGKVGLIVIDAFARRTETIGQTLRTKFESAPAVYQSRYFINLERLIHSRRQFVTFNKKRMPPLDTQILRATWRAFGIR
jgi:hypothetical protein